MLHANRADDLAEGAARLARLFEGEEDTTEDAGPPVTPEEVATMRATLAPVVPIRRPSATPPFGLARVADAALHLGAVALLVLGLGALTSCAALEGLLAPAAQALGPLAIGAAEAAVRSEAAKRGIALTDPALLDAIKAARAADAAEAKRAEKRAAEAKARDEEEARRIGELAAAVAALPRSCPACPRCPELPQAPAVLPVVDAGADGAP